MKARLTKIAVVVVVVIVAAATVVSVHTAYFAHQCFDAVGRHLICKNSVPAYNNCYGNIWE